MVRTSGICAAENGNVVKQALVDADFGRRQSALCSSTLIALW